MVYDEIKIFTFIFLLYNNFILYIFQSFWVDQKHQMKSQPSNSALSVINLMSKYLQFLKLTIIIVIFQINIITT